MAKAPRFTHIQVSPLAWLREPGSCGLGVDAMKTTYVEDEDTLVIRLSDKPVVREVSQDWNTHVSYAADGTLVETVILEATRIGAWPLQVAPSLGSLKPHSSTM